MSIAGTFGKKADNRIHAGKQPETRPQENAMSMIMKFVENDSGATAVEYGLIAAAAGFALSAIMPILKNT